MPTGGAENAKAEPRLAAILAAEMSGYRACRVPPPCAGPVIQESKFFSVLGNVSPTRNCDTSQRSEEKSKMELFQKVTSDHKDLIGAYVSSALAAIIIIRGQCWASHYRSPGVRPEEYRLHSSDEELPDAPPCLGSAPLFASTL
jgi:hypothetical protein